MDNERAEYGADIEHLTSQRVAPMPPIRLSGGDVEMSIPEWTRTTNLRLRRPALYPIELRGHGRVNVVCSIDVDPRRRMADDLWASRVNRTL